MNLKSFSLMVVVLAVAVFIAQTAVGTIAKAQDDSLILSKLNEVLKGQQAIAADIASIKSELNVVKIRVTQIQ